MKIYISSFKTSPMDISLNTQKSFEQIKHCHDNNSELIVFPKMFLLGCDVGILENVKWFNDRYNEHIYKIFEYAKQYNIAVICDMATSNGFKTVFFSDGKVIIRDKCTVKGFNIFCADSSEALFKNMKTIANNNDVVVINWAQPTVAGQRELWIKHIKMASSIYGTTFIFNAAGDGYTTYPNFFAQMRGIVSLTDIDVKVLYKDLENSKSVFEIQKNSSKNIFPDNLDYHKLTQFDVVYNQNPLIPKNVDIKNYCLELFDMQCSCLANRLNNIKCKSVVLNLSGGLDSTLAAMVCVNAFDMLNLDKNGIRFVTMPGFGTSNKTKKLVNALCENLSIPFKNIDITDICTDALHMIGHNATTADVTFENVQARMRTLNALNLSNYTNAIMVGTGDLSEEALGFSTYGGDHLASYNVNCCVSKTVIRHMLKYIAEMDLFKNCKNTIYQILDLPISPELTPFSGDISQKTENIIAPYSLIDFFIYCLVVTKISPQETVEKAYVVFKQEFSREYILEKLILFYKKFAVGQFKRSCCPECANITHASLLGLKTYFPSDASIDIFIQNLK